MNYKLENFLPSFRSYNSTIENYLYEEAQTLPKLPLPALKDTLNNYLELVKTLVTPEKLTKTKKLVKEFQDGIGSDAQKYLTKRYDKHLNWSTEHFTENYLKFRKPLTIYLNPGCVMPPRNFKDLRDVAEFGTAAIMACVDLKMEADNKRVSIDTIGKKKDPLCMAQWYGVFTSCREPALNADNIVSTFGEIPQQEHVIVFHKNQIYSVVLKREFPRGISSWLTPAQITNELLTILEATETTLESPVGILTTWDRDNWTKAYEILNQEPKNRINIDIIKSSLMVVCFDEGLPTHFNSRIEFATATTRGFKIGERDETNMFLEMLHGGGSAHNGANRWYDKTVQVIVCKDGANGATMEHTVIDGMMFTNLMERISEKADAMERQPRAQLEKAPKNSTTRLTWIMNPDLNQFISEASVAIDKLVDDFDSQAFRFMDFGKEDIKRLNCSPDVFVQLSLQCAIFNLHGKMETSWESISTRRFLLGRLDTGHSHSSQTLELLKALKDPKVDEAVRLKLMEDAIEYHTQKMQECANGNGFDLHLAALQRASILLTDRIPDMFNDVTYATLTKYTIGTSQVPTIKEMFVGFGYKYRDNYACCYNIRDDHIIFCVNTWKSIKNVSTKNFCKSITQALIDNKNLLQKRNNRT